MQHARIKKYCPRMLALKRHAVRARGAIHLESLLTLAQYVALLWHQLSRNRKYLLEGTCAVLPQQYDSSIGKMDKLLVLALV